MLLSTSLYLHAGFASAIENSIGWIILDSKTIDGYKNEEGEKEDSFEGCDYERIIYFRDGTTVTCNLYGYQYAYAPTAIILGKSITYEGKEITMLKMIVEGVEYNLY